MTYENYHVFTHTTIYNKTTVSNIQTPMMNYQRTNQIKNKYLVLGLEEVAVY